MTGVHAGEDAKFFNSLLREGKVMTVILVNLLQYNDRQVNLQVQ